MQKIIQIHPCKLKFSRKQESVTDGLTDRQKDKYIKLNIMQVRGIRCAFML
jgi:hypothetical protein